MNASVVAKATEIAYALYPQVSWHRATHFAFLLKGSRIAFVGWNKAKSHPTNQKHPYGPSSAIHAELDVILRSKSDDLSQFDLLVLRIDRNMRLNQSKPCVGCQSLIEQVGVRRVWWSDETGQIKSRQSG